MTSPAPLTEAEAAAARALAGDFECSWHVGCDEECRADMARAVVAAVRPLIAEETLRETAKYLYEHRRDYDGAYDLFQMYEAGGPEWLSSRAAAARQSLSLPASKETPMPEPTTVETGHAVNVAAGTFGGDPWLYLECACGWRIGFDTACDPRELYRAAAAHETADA